MAHWTYLRVSQPSQDRGYSASHRSRGTAVEERWATRRNPFDAERNEGHVG